MTRFKLRKDSLHKSRFVNSFRNHLLLSELNYHRRNVHTAQLTQDISNLEAKIYGNAFFFLTKIRIKAFIKKLIDNYIYRIQQIHKRKLSDLGLHNSHSINDSAIFNDTRVLFTEEELNLIYKHFLRKHY